MSELSDKAIEQLQFAVHTKILNDADGNQYFTRPVFPICPRVLPEPACLKVSTLTGLIDFCEMHDARNAVAVIKKTGSVSSDDMEFNPDLEPPIHCEPAVVHVVDHSEVRVLSQPFGPAKQTTCFLKASFVELLGASFQFGKFYDQESFIIGLQSLFLGTPARAEVLKAIGTIRDNQVREFGDDGVTQSVSAKAGVALVSEIPVPNPVVLSPYRTFREIEQPASPFILRVKPGQNGKPECALFEADGGLWKLFAIQGITEFLRDRVNLTILA